MNRRIRLFLALLLVAISSAAHAQTNLVANPSFESGFASWATKPAATGSNIYVSANDPHSGGLDATFGGSNYDTITQYLDTSGMTYFDVSFWVFNDSSFPNAFRVTFGSMTLLDATNLQFNGYTQYTFTGIPGSASGTPLSFSGYDAGAGYLRLDDVAVTASAVPEPSTWIILGIGSAIISLSHRRRLLRQTGRTRRLDMIGCCGAILRSGQA